MTPKPMSADTMVERVARIQKRLKRYEDGLRVKSFEIGDNPISDEHAADLKCLIEAIQSAKAGDWHSRVENADLHDRIERLEAEKRLCVEALEAIQDHSTERACMTSTEHTEHTLSEVQDIARTTLSAVGEIRDQED